MGRSSVHKRVVSMDTGKHTVGDGATHMCFFSFATRSTSRLIYCALNCRVGRACTCPRSSSRRTQGQTWWHRTRAWYKSPPKPLPHTLTPATYLIHTSDISSLFGLRCPFKRQADATLWLGCFADCPHPTRTSHNPAHTTLFPRSTFNTCSSRSSAHWCAALVSVASHVFSHQQLPTLRLLLSLRVCLFQV